MRLFQRLSVVVVLAFAPYLSVACGRLPAEVEVKQRLPLVEISLDVNVLAAADLASAQELKAIAFAQKLAAVRAEEQPRPHEELQSTVPPVSSNPPSTGTVAAASPPETQPGTGGVWICIANAETGGVPAPGPTYWTVYGVVTDVVTGWGTPEEQAAVFGGYATPGQELDIVTKFAAQEGFGGWGVLTKEKCGLS